mmetsp:Transcript_15975/g.53495  ORF Transcript_15975/g.53495 Transcript_15975/m.53495 type:complete len:257 (+) Transcript_15975:2374-3144(+)
MTSSDQEKTLSKCMAQDCVQSLESAAGQQSYEGCRFVDVNGFCYASMAAQEYCTSHPEDTGCNDGGSSWAYGPLGNYQGGGATGWTPAAHIPYKGDAASMGFQSCSCMKNCACSGTKCFCVNEKEAPVGEGSFVPSKIIQGDKTGQCSCFCSQAAVKDTTSSDVTTASSGNSGVVASSTSDAPAINGGIDTNSIPSPPAPPPPPSPPPPYLALSLRWVGGRPADVLPASTLIYRMKERRTAGCGRMRRAAAMEGTP